MAGIPEQAHALAAAVNSGQLEVGAVVEHFAQRTRTEAPRLNSHIYWDEAAIRAQIVYQEMFIKEARRSGRSLPLAGVPILLKDNIATKGVPTTCGSRILQGFTPIFDATVVGKLRAAGALFFGKANMDEFAMGSTNEHSAFGPVKNPRDIKRVPGGSSGGSAAAVAAGMVPLALGSDTGGSVRAPASFCGVVGFKPTYGTVSRYGLIAYGSSLDQIGPIAHTVRDTTLLYDVIRGHDHKDSTSLIEQRSETRQPVSLKGFKVGRVREFFADGLAPDVLEAVTLSLTKLENAGATIVDISLPVLKYSVPVYYIVACAEASANLARFDGVRYGYRAAGTDDNLQELYIKSRSEGFGREVKQRIMLGTYVLSSGYYDAYYSKATRLRHLISQELANALKQVDVLVSPTFPITAPLIGELVDDPLTMYLSDLYTIAVNLAGIPAISVPCGVDRKGLPVGIQFWGAHGGDDRLLAFSQTFEDMG